MLIPYRPGDLVIQFVIEKSCIIQLGEIVGNAEFFVPYLAFLQLIFGIKAFGYLGFQFFDPAIGVQHESDGQERG